jgi:hypothetical protein
VITGSTRRTLGGEFLGCALQLIRHDIRQDDGYAAVDEPGRQGTAQSLCRPGHHRNLTRFDDHFDSSPFKPPQIAAVRPGFG